MSNITFPTPQITTLTSYDLERYVAALFQSHGYFVKRDLWWSESMVSNASHSVDILQADVLAYSFFPFTESILLVECKGGGVFTDLFKFSGIVNLIKPNSAFFISNNSPLFDELHKVGKTQNINVLRPKDIINTFSTLGTQDQIWHWFWSNCLQDAILKKENLCKALSTAVLTSEQAMAYSEIRKYDTLVSSKIWTKIDPVEQANLLYNHLNTNQGFVASILKIQKLPRTDAENAIATNLFCDAAANVVLKAKLEYIVTAVRCAISMITSTDSNYLDGVADANFKIVVQKMVDEIQIACKLPYFLQFWIYQFGGILNTNGDEIVKFAKLLNEREENVYAFIKLIDETFSILTSSGKISWLLNNRSGIYEVMAVPDSIRGYGIYFRDLNFIDTTPFVYKVQWLKRLKKITGY